MIAPIPSRTRSLRDKASSSLRHTAGETCSCEPDRRMGTQEWTHDDGELQSKPGNIP